MVVIFVIGNIAIANALVMKIPAASGRAKHDIVVASGRAKRDIVVASGGAKRDIVVASGRAKREGKRDYSLCFWMYFMRVARSASEKQNLLSKLFV